MTKLSSIDLSENNFVGSLPDLTKLVHLSVFDGSNNQFEDNMFSIFYNPIKFPLTIKVLQLSNNKITGSFSDKYWFTFQTSILDLSGNNLSTTSNSSLKLLLCSCFSEVHAFIDLSRNPQFSAALPDCVLKHSKELTHVDIDVRFTGLRGNSSIQLYQNINRHDYVTLR
jgi:Leucine-rich repeat (LRR) protein